MFSSRKHKMPPPLTFFQILPSLIALQRYVAHLLAFPCQRSAQRHNNVKDDVI